MNPALIRYAVRPASQEAQRPAPELHLTFLDGHHVAVQLNPDPLLLAASMVVAAKAIVDRYLPQAEKLAECGTCAGRGRTMVPLPGADAARNYFPAAEVPCGHCGGKGYR